MIPPPSWNKRNFLLVFNFTIAHIPGKMNTAADILSRLESDAKERTILKIIEDVPAQTIEINIESTVMAQNQPVFFSHRWPWIAIQISAMAAQTRKRQSCTTEPPIITVSHWHINDKCTNTVMQNMEPFNKVARLLNGQNADAVLLIFKWQIHGLPFDEETLATDHRYTHYCRGKKRSVIEDHILYTQYYNDAGDVSYLQVFSTVQLKDIVPNWLLDQAGKHPGTSVEKGCEETDKNTIFHQLRTTSVKG